MKFHKKDLTILQIFYKTKYFLIFSRNRQIHNYSQLENDSTLDIMLNKANLTECHASFLYYHFLEGPHVAEETSSIDGCNNLLKENRKRLEVTTEANTQDVQPL